MDIPATSDEFDTQLMREYVSPEELPKIWSGDANNIVKDKVKLILYCHHLL